MCASVHAYVRMCMHACVCACVCISMYDIQSEGRVIVVYMEGEN